MIGLVLMALVALFVLPGFVNPIGQGIGETFGIVARGIFFVIIIALPALVAIAMFYIALSKDNSKDKMNMVVFGALYGIALYILMVYFGLINMALSYFNSITGAWFGSWGADWVTTISSTLITVFLFLEGMALAVIDKTIWTLTHLRQALHNIKQRAKNFNKRFT